MESKYYAAFKAAILAETDSEFVALRNVRSTGPMAVWLNQNPGTNFVVWKTSVSRDECLGDGFDFTQVDNLTVGQARIFEWLFDNSGQRMNPAEAGKRAAIGEVWKGTAGKVAVGTYLTTLFKRNASRVEKYLATGTGTDGSPATMTFEGKVSFSDVEQAIDS